jgi:ferredoxin
MNALEKLRASRQKPSGRKLRVDPVECESIGQCAVVASRLVQLDRWGYPIVQTGELVSSDVGQAQRAVNACPRDAMFLEATS